MIRQKQIITHEEERAALILFLIGGFTIWFMFRWTEILCTAVHKIVYPPNMSYQILYIGFNHQLVLASIHKVVSDFVSQMRFYKSGFT